MVAVGGPRQAPDVLTLLQFSIVPARLEVLLIL